jgi:hypothetical protein
MNRLTFIVIALASALLMVGSAAGQETVIERGPVTYYLDTPAQIDRIDSALTDARRRLVPLLMDSLVFPLRLYVAGSSDRFNSLVGGRFPEWGAAAALVQRRMIVIKSPDEFNLARPIEELVAHEFSHLALAHRLGGRSAPRWFDEGLAQMISYQWSWGDNVTASLGAATGNLVSLREIEQVNAFAGSQARLAYAQSYLAVHYLYDVYGTAAVMQFLEALKEGRGVNAALMAATGSNYDDFQQEFFVYLHERHNMITLIADMEYFWIGLAFVLVAGAVLAYFRKRRQYRTWDREEELGSTDFDYGDPDEPESPDEDDSWRG